MDEEIILMKTFPHPFIVKIIDDFVDQNYKCIVLHLYPEKDF